MSLVLSDTHLVRVCEYLALQRDVFVHFDAEQINPVGVYIAPTEDRQHLIILNSNLEPWEANFIVLHELMHAKQFERGGDKLDWLEEAEAVGLDPDLYLPDPGTGVFQRHRELTEEEAELYNSMPLEVEANEFARSFEDLFQVIL